MGELGAGYERCALVVDDAGVLGPLALQLVRLGVDAIHASDSQEGMLIARENGTRIGAVVVSANGDLPALDGLLSQMGASDGSARPSVVAVGPSSDATRRDALRKLGARWALLQPFDAAELRFAVTHAIAVGCDQELRIEPRLPVDLGTIFHRGSVRAIARIRNLSVGGAFVATRTPPELGDPVKLEIDLPGASIEPLARVAHVRLAEPPDRSDMPIGFGVAFEVMDTRMETPLREYLATRFAHFAL